MRSEADDSSLVRNTDAGTDGDGSSGPAAVTRSWDSDGSPLIPLIEAVAEATDQRPEGMEPLHSVIDVGALEGILSADQRGGEREITFEYEGCTVTVSDSGLLTVHPETDR